MIFKTLALSAFVALLTLSTASAQTGTLDQVSPATNAGFNRSASTLIWQQQVRVGLAGQLEGFEMNLTGVVGAYVDLRVRVGDGWNVGPVVWSGSHTKTTPNQEDIFFDVTSASINLASGATFVIETQGNDTGMGIRGSYEAPPGAPLYPEFLFLNGPGCFADCGWRHGFRTWMVAGGPTSYCAPANANSLFPGGAVLTSTGGFGTASATFNITDLPNQPGILYSGPTAIDLPFGCGRRCIGGTVTRGSVLVASGNQISGATFDMNSASTANIQFWYRDPANFAACGDSFNLSNALMP